MMSKSVAKPGNLVRVTRMDEQNLAVVVGYKRDGFHGDPHTSSRVVMLRFIKGCPGVDSDLTFAYDVKDLEVIS